MPWLPATALFAGLTILATAAPAPPPALAPSAGACRHVALIDRTTHAAIAGAEDMAIDEATGDVYVSAYDRWRSEDAPAGAASAGGLYRLTPGDLALAAEHGRLGVTPLADARAPPLRPHGIALGPSPWGKALYVINHRRRPAGPVSTISTSLEIFRVTADGLVHAKTIESERLCQANDVAVGADGRLFVSRDHGSCSEPGMWLENVLGLARAEVIELTSVGAGTPAAVLRLGGLGFANGLAVDQRQGILYVAATRDRAVRGYLLSTLADAGAAPISVTSLEAGPDNLTLDADGRLLVAAHPSLLRYGLYRYRWRSRVPGLALEMEPQAGLVRVIFDDPEGALLPGVTVALRARDRLLLGAAFAEGIVMCDDRARRADRLRPRSAATEGPSDRRAETGS